MKDYINAFRPMFTEYICTKCKTHENIPTDVVLNMDMMDDGDPSYPPMFNCEKCNGLMKPNNIKKEQRKLTIICQFPLLPLVVLCNHLRDTKQLLYRI